MQAELWIDPLPAKAVDASAEFHANWLDRVRRALGKDVNSLVLVLPSAPYDHRDWRLAVIRDLARAAAPKRVNMIAGDDQAAIRATAAYLAHASAVTGQYLPVDGQGNEIAAS